MAEKNKHILIIGGGLIGFSCAYFLRKRGHSVTLLERRQREAESCSTHNAGMIVPSHFIPLAAPGMIKLGLKWMFNPESPFYIRPRPDFELARWCWRFYRASSRERCEMAMPVLRDLLVESRELFKQLAAADEIGFELHERGLLMLCKHQRTLDHEAAVASKAHELEIDARVLDRRALAELDPGAQMDVAGAVHFPGDGFLTPDRFLERLRERAIGLGVEVCWETAVGNFGVDGRKITSVSGNGEAFSADEIVIAGGAWSTGIAARLGIDLPMQAGKGYSVTLPDPPALPEICSILTEARVAVTPMDGALRVGGTMEITGLDESINTRRVRGIAKSLPAYYPQFDAAMFEGLAVWNGLRPCSPDGLPYIGRVAGFDNLTLATGHAMLGLSLAPVTGKMVTEIIGGNSPRDASSLVSPGRYQS